MKDKRLWVLLGGIALMSAVFLPLNFRVALSNTQTIPRIMTRELKGNYPARTVTVVGMNEGVIRLARM